MNKELLLVGVIATCTAGILIFQAAVNNASNQNSSVNPFQSSNTQTVTPGAEVTQEVDRQAAFAIFANGVFRVFTDPMYHNLSPDVYIESGSSNIIRVKKSGVTWNDFFRTLPLTLSQTCLITGTKEVFCTDHTKSLKFYLNGEYVSDALNREIQDADQLLVSFGPDIDSTIPQQIQRIPVPYSN